ncbi:MAG: hypothetical protein RLZZ338_2498 [Cyanobacteriota bacterium]
MTFFIIILSPIHFLTVRVVARNRVFARYFVRVEEMGKNPVSLIRSGWFRLGWVSCLNLTYNLLRWFMLGFVPQPNLQSGNICVSPISQIINQSRKTRPNDKHCRRVLPSSCNLLADLQWLLSAHHQNYRNSPPILANLKDKQT